MSEPHTCEFNGETSLTYVYMLVYMYRMYVHCTHTHAVCGQYAHDLKTLADLDTFIIFSRFRVVLLFVVNIDILNASRRAQKPSQDKEDRL